MNLPVARNVTSTLVLLVFVSTLPVLAEAPASTLFLGPQFDAARVTADMVATDLDGDGRVDLVVTDRLSDEVAILWGDPKSVFVPQSKIPVGTRPEDIAVLDADDDGRPDLLFASHSTGEIRLLLQEEDRMFREQTPPLTLLHPTDMAAGDLNGDGRDDAFVTGDSGRLWILLGNGDGTFQVTDRPFLGVAFGIEADDVNEDDNLDLILAVYSLNRIRVLLGDGAGGFLSERDYLTPAGPVSTVLVDLNRDGIKDLISANRTYGNISVFTGRGGGDFVVTRHYPTLGSPRILLPFDADLDGDVDLIVGNGASARITYLRGVDGGPFEGPVLLPIQGSEVRADDVDGDGITDLLTSTNHVEWMRGDGKGGFGPTLIPVGEHPWVAVSSDLDGNGTPDLLTGNLISLSFLPGAGDGTFGSERRLPLDNPFEGMVVGRVGADQRPGVLYAKEDGEMTVITGIRDGAFETIGPLQTGFGPLAMADFDADGLEDLAIARSNPGSVAFHRGTSDGRFPYSGSQSVGSGILRDIVAADFNRDGLPDLAFPRFTAKDLAILMNQGGGQFLKGETPIGDSPLAVVAADWNGDGFPDIAVGGSSSNELHILPGLGDGTFADPVTYSDSWPSRYLATGDLNGDTIPDLISSTESGFVAVSLARSDGTLRPPVRFSNLGGARSIVVGDWNGDGWNDLATANTWNDSVSILLNQIPELGGGPTRVPIDLIPTSDQNRVNLKSHGVTTVAILGTGEFSVDSVIPTTILLAGGRPKTDGSGVVLCDMEDVNDDGFPDLVCKIATDDMRVPPGATQVVLLAETVDGGLIRGDDRILVVHP